MSWTQSDVDAIDTAIKNATLSVRLGDKTVQYRSMDDLLKARALAVSEVAKAAAASQGGSSRYSLADFRE